MKTLRMSCRSALRLARQLLADAERRAAEERRRTVWLEERVGVLAALLQGRSPDDSLGNGVGETPAESSLPVEPPAKYLAVWIIAGLGVLVITMAAAYSFLRQVPLELPEPVHVNLVPFENSDWTREERRWFYHASEGARLMPYTWFVALEQIDNEKRFINPDHLTQFRMIPDTDRENNPDLLPVGFARDCLEPRDPAAIDTEYVGIACAACHTGQINYKGKGLQIDGAPSQFDILGFLARLAFSLEATLEEDAKFDRFASKVLGSDDNSTNKYLLRQQVEKYIDEEIVTQHPIAFAKQVIESGGKLTYAGFGRMDALGMGSNTLLGQLSPENLRTLDSPVDVLPLWNAYSYGWVQTNGAIRQPMARNIVETMSVYAYVDLLRAPWEAAESGYPSSVRMKNLWMMESMAARLKPPDWPLSLFGEIDQAKAARGRSLYQNLCASCHEPELETLATNDGPQVVGGPYPPDPVSESTGKRFYHLRLFDVDYIGTDPLDATNFAQRHADATAMGLKANEPVGFVIQPIMAGIMQNYYLENGIQRKEQNTWNGYRSNYWRTPKAYPARPLAGIWATAPFLHNGSVPNLYELLSPVEDRSKTFYRGNLEFDPVKVGFETGAIKGGFELDTTTTGNSNAGHEFRDGKGKGVIGRRLTEAERWQIIEYLKVLRFDQKVPPEWNPPSDWPWGMECPQPQSAPVPGTGSPQ